MYTTNPNVIETDDIVEVRQLGEAQTLPDGRTALPLLLILSTDSEGNGKSYGAGAFPHTFHVTNGVFPRNLPILPAPAPEFGVPSEPAEQQSEPAAPPADSTDQEQEQEAASSDTTEQEQEQEATAGGKKGAKKTGAEG